MLDFAIKQNGSKKSLFEKKKSHIWKPRKTHQLIILKKKNQMKERQTRYLEVNENENPVCQNLTVKSVQKKKTGISENQ